jgi:hypothetical protein
MRDQALADLKAGATYREYGNSSASTPDDLDSEMELQRFNFRVS